MVRRRKRSRADAPEPVGRGPQRKSPDAPARGTARRSSLAVVAAVVAALLSGIGSGRRGRRPRRARPLSRLRPARERPQRGRGHARHDARRPPRLLRLPRRRDAEHRRAWPATGVVFEHATATVPLTFPSHSSIFTGLVPPHHGVRDNGGFFLDDAKVTLAERLHEAGLRDGRLRRRLGARVASGGSPRASTSTRTSSTSRSTRWSRSAPSRSRATR